ncbi:DEAD/DEAH box helicase [Fredinandcohnia sp. QZ13]|uniref:DEAD/DEAH box helicase n=1 Tax=Fredinandcohnia sp. QZ13 TaxID=3073144 RepID=UPI0028531A0A|nr:DEAD/DEAH box helicase [Fredinandcohnia sp. QZ13]MDR4886350.1 DEAD/DEAH box helicase [Fredinandcohnia sp. QZ13]
MSIQLEQYYNQAVERAKQMIIDDIHHYLEQLETMPTYEQYVRERGSFIEQLWLNAWLNTAVQAPISEKKAYLEERGFDVDGVAKKLLNKLFRTEIRDVEPYDFISWLEEKFANQPNEWEKKYQSARENFESRMKQQQEREKKRKFILKLNFYLNEILSENYEELYLRIRYLLGSHLTIEIDQKGMVLSSKDITFASYLYKETELAHNRYFYQENLIEQYEDLILHQLMDFGPNWLKSHLPEHLFKECEMSFQEPLSDAFLQEVAYEYFLDVRDDLFEDILEEYVADLVKLIDIPFDLDTHKEIFERNITERKERVEKEKEELRRQKEEEQRMIENIFGQAYHLSPGRNIQYILHVGETNTGKTFQAIQRMKEENSGIYLAPLRLLALEIFEKLNNEGVPCNLKTGEEEKVVEGANHLSATVEMLREKDFYEIVVIDEAQMISDKDRGFSWYKAITNANAKEVHIICSFHAKWMILQLLGNSNVEVHEYHRDIPLEVETQLFRLNQTRKGDALVCFSRRRVLETASELQRNGRRVSMIYGSMPPETRKKQIERFNNGETTVIVATDAIGMGLNLPIRRIVFLENDKFDGTRRRLLTSQEVKQIAGRAGRRGIYDIGKVAFTSDIKTMTRLLEHEDEPLRGFAIAPTNAVLERFQKYSRKMRMFFYLWDQFKSPEGTKKASLYEERMLYELVEDTIIEAKLSLPDLYGFLHLPFSSNEPSLRAQWKKTLEAIVDGTPLPDPILKESGLEELELSYKAVGLHLLFLYKLGKHTETLYWERVREEISDKIHEQLKSGIQTTKRVCKRCGKNLPIGFSFAICNECYFERPRRSG